jgi:hypothetical protein
MSNFISTNRLNTNSLNVGKRLDVSNSLNVGSSLRG